MKTGVNALLLVKTGVNALMLIGEDGRGRPDAHTGEDGRGRPDALHDVTVQTRRTQECARVEGVPPEEFGIARHARSIRDADYCFHEVLRPQARLIEQGYDRAQVLRLPSDAASGTIEARARDTVDESALGRGDDGPDGASRLIRITEHYLRMDYEGDGRPALYRVTTAGGRSCCATARPTSSARRPFRSRR